MGCFIVINAKMVIHYEEEGVGPENRGIRAIVIAGFTLSYFVIFLLPIDVRNSRNDGGLDMETFWSAMFIIIVICSIFVLPLSMFLHDARGDDGIIKNNKAWRRTFTSFIFYIIGLIIVTGITFAIFNTAKLPIIDVGCSNWLDADASIQAKNICQTQTERFLEFTVRFDIYLIALFCFLGWWMFVVFGGVGLTALPMDLIVGYIDRPQPISAATHQAKKKLCRDTAEALLKIATELQEKDAELHGKTGRFEKKKRVYSVCKT